MDVFKDVNVDDIRVDMVLIKLWHKALLLCKDKPEWCDKPSVIEICLCSPCSNATLERDI